MRSRNISPPYMAMVNNRSVHILSQECVRDELTAIDTSLTALAWTANLLVFVPLIVDEPLTVSQFFWENGTAVDGNTDVGIYSFDGQTKLGSTGATLNAGTSQIQVVNVTDFTLPPNVRLWLALGSESGTQTYFAANLVTVGLDFIGVTQQASGWSSGLPTTITPAAASQAKLPLFGFTGGVI